MSVTWIQTIGTIVVALLGGGIVKAFVDYLRDRRTGALEQSAFEFKTLSEMNDRLRAEIKELRAEIEEERKRMRAELDEERTKRRQLEDELATEKRERQRLANRVAELEAHRGDSTS